MNSFTHYFSQILTNQLQMLQKILIYFAYILQLFVCILHQKIYVKIMCPTYILSQFFTWTFLTTLHHLSQLLQVKLVLLPSVLPMIAHIQTSPRSSITSHYTSKRLNFCISQKIRLLSVGNILIILWSPPLLSYLDP